MREARSRLLFVLAVGSLLGLPGRAEAQSGFLDWISKLSGPEIYSAGVSWDYCLDQPIKRNGKEGGSRFFGCEDTAWLIRGAVAESYSSSDTPEGSSGDVDLFQFAPTALRRWPLAQLELGMAFHRFSGDGFDSFWRHAFVVGLAFTPALLRDRSLYLEVGPRLRYFPDAFEDQDFGGDPEPEDSGGEWSWGGVLALRYRF